MDKLFQNIGDFNEFYDTLFLNTNAMEEVQCNMKLYIIGNGFDREHGLKTSYIHFRNYLEKYAEDFLTAMEHMYNITSWEKLDRRNKKI